LKLEERPQTVATQAKLFLSPANFKACKHLDEKTWAASLWRERLGLILIQRMDNLHQSILMEDRTTRFSSPKNASVTFNE
jgi:hypothetical protein